MSRPGLGARLAALEETSRELWRDFARDVRPRHAFHPFVPTDFDAALRVLFALRSPGLRFLEWGSGTGVVTVMADMLGFDACGIELDPGLVGVARKLARRTGSGARFAHGSFLPSGYWWRSSTGDPRLGTIGEGASGYPELGRFLTDFGVVFGYPWDGEAPMMRDLMARRGRPDAVLVLNLGPEGIQSARAGSPGS